MSIYGKQAEGTLEPLLQGSGYILFHLQQLEHMVKLCCAFLEIKGIQVSIDDILSEEPGKRFYTLGKILKAMKEPMGFKSAFQERLDSFVKARNTFIHDYWVTKEIYTINDSVNQTTFQEIASFQSALSTETIYITEVFIGLHYSIGAELAAREGKAEEFLSDTTFDDMKQYAPKFLDVIEV